MGGTLRMVLGDQLSHAGFALQGMRPGDTVLMAEVDAEASGEGAGIRSHKLRSCIFLASMRAFAAELEAQGVVLRYVKLDDPDNSHALGGELGRAVAALKPAEIRLTQPGEWRVLRELEASAADAGCPLRLGDDTHFMVSTEAFTAWAAGRKSFRLEHFYRAQRKARGILMRPEGEPEGGEWNYDKDNRRSFKQAPRVPPPLRFPMTPLREEVRTLIETRYPSHPGNTEAFALWPVTADEADALLEDFIAHRLVDFGPFEDAMWSGEAFLYHARLSVPLNLKLIDPRRCIEAACQAYAAGNAPLASVEGFVRQILGWREFIRGIYWHSGEGYRERNALEAQGTLPAFFWTGETDMACLADTLKSVIETAYSHHIPRLMVLANFCLIAGIHPRQVGDWFFEMYADAVDWVTTPNTLGMALFADGGVVGSKPYAASGKYIKRMSNYCKGCRYDVNLRDGEAACPYNTFYWDFLLRHETRFACDPRMALVCKSASRIDPQAREKIVSHARLLRQRFGVEAEAVSRS